MNFDSIVASSRLPDILSVPRTFAKARPVIAGRLCIGPLPQVRFGMDAELCLVVAVEVVLGHGIGSVSHPVHRRLLSNTCGRAAGREEVTETVGGDLLEAWVGELCGERPQCELAKMVSKRFASQSTAAWAVKESVVAVSGQTFNHLAYSRMDGEHTAITRLGRLVALAELISDVDESDFEVDVIPCQLSHFSKSHSGVR